MRFSKIISTILHPIFMPIMALYLSLKLVPGIGFAITNYLNFIYLILLVSTIILPLMSVLFLIKKKLVSSLEMDDYNERSLPLFIAAIWMIYGYYKLAGILALAPILSSELLGAIIILFVASAISKYWKISLHMLAAGGVTGMLLGLNILFGNLEGFLILSFLLSGVLGFSRLNEKAHNHAQIYTGFLTGLLIESGSIFFF
tara:strand:- start:240 stop:842 length:603 start_codon:yes stop_codon:yes gene_type:complete